MAYWQQYRRFGVSGFNLRLASCAAKVPYPYVLLLYLLMLFINRTAVAGLTRFTSCLAIQTHSHSHTITYTHTDTTLANCIFFFFLKKKGGTVDSEDYSTRIRPQSRGSAWLHQSMLWYQSGRVSMLVDVLLLPFGRRTGGCRKLFLSKLYQRDAICRLSVNKQSISNINRRRTGNFPLSRSRFWVLYSRAVWNLWCQLTTLLKRGGGISHTFAT